MQMGVWQEGDKEEFILFFHKMDMGCLIRTCQFCSCGFAHRELFLFLFQQWVEGLRSIIHNFRANNVSPMTCLKKQ